MRFLFLLFIFFAGSFLFSTYAFASTVVTDDILEDTTWTLDGSPYLIDGYVPVYSKLTIEPGVVVQNGSLDILGTLIAEGTSSQHISFNSSTIYFTGSVDSSLKYIDISHAHYGMSFWTADATVSNINMQNNDTDLDIEEGSNISISDSNFSNAKYNSVYISDSSLTANNLTIDGGSQHYSAVNSRFSQISIIDSFIQNMPDAQAFFAGRLSSVDLDNVNIKNEGRGFMADESSIVNIKNNSTFDNTYVYAFGGSVFNIDKSVFKNSIWGGIVDFGQGETFNITNSKFINNVDGIYNLDNGSNPESVYNISNSEISGNSEAGVYNEALYPIDFKNVWWGDASGPLHPDLNPNGTGNAVSDNVDFITFCKNVECKTKTPVIIVPGLLGSHISKNYDDNSEIWPNVNKLLLSITDTFMDDLALLADGTENPDMPMTLGDIVRSVSVGNSVVTDTWDGLINKLTSPEGGYIEGTDLFVFPYDWRKGDADTAVLLKDKIDAVLVQTGVEKVDIISHSMGGLVAEKYVADNGKDKIDKLFFIGVPHLGAPKAFKALMYGDDMGINIINASPFRILNPAEIKKIGQNMPSTFDLLPSRVYVNGNPNASIVLPNKYVYDSVAGKWLDYNETKNFMINNGRNADIFPQADTLHQSVNKADLTGIDTYNFAGCGTTKTLARIVAKKKKSWTSLWQKVVDDYDLQYTNGDETVPLVSASGAYDHKYFIKGATHAELPSFSGVPDTILALLSGNTAPTETNISTNDNDFCDVTGRVVSTHSPVTMHIYDDQGHHTGPVDNGDIEYGIPGVSYDTIEGDAFAFLPEGGNYKVINKATDTGAYDFYVKEIGANDEITKETYFNEIPLTNLASNSEIDFTPANNDYKIKMDQDGDNIFEKEFAPSSSLNADQVADLTAPETTSEISGKVLFFNASDDNSGILKTEYSLDDGASWILYIEPFSASGKNVKYFSTDKAGNIEVTREVNVPDVKEIIVSSDNENILKIRHSFGGRGPALPAIFSPNDTIQIVKENAPIKFSSENKIIAPVDKKITNKKLSLSISPKTVAKVSKDTQKSGIIEKQITSSLLTASVVNANLKIGFWDKMGNFIKNIFIKNKNKK